MPNSNPKGDTLYISYSKTSYISNMEVFLCLKFSIDNQ
jgi:hypothetical protein